MKRRIWGCGCPSGRALGRGRSRWRPESGLAKHLVRRRDFRVIELDEEQQRPRAWFESLRDRICAEFERIEDEASDTPGRFTFTPWERSDPDGSPGGGGVQGLLKGRVFEKVGVHVSTVAGRFTRSEEQTSELQSLMRTSYADFCLKKQIPHNSQQI